MHLKLVLSISIDEPIQVVFDRFVDPSFDVRVDKNSRSVEMIDPADGGPLSKGSKWVLTLNAPFGQTMTQKQTLSEYESPYRFALELEQKGFSGVEVETFEVGEDGAVQVTWNADWKLDWYVVPLYPLLRWKVKSGSKSWLARMKKAIEAGE